MRKVLCIALLFSGLSFGQVIAQNAIDDLKVEAVKKVTEMLNLDASLDMIAELEWLKDNDDFTGLTKENKAQIKKEKYEVVNSASQGNDLTALESSDMELLISKLKELGVIDSYEKWLNVKSESQDTQQKLTAEGVLMKIEELSQGPLTDSGYKALSKGVEQKTLTPDLFQDEAALKVWIDNNMPAPTTITETVPKRKWYDLPGKQIDAAKAQVEAARKAAEEAIAKAAEIARQASEVAKAEAAANQETIEVFKEQASNAVQMLATEANEVALKAEELATQAKSLAAKAQALLSQEKSTAPESKQPKTVFDEELLKSLAEEFGLKPETVEKMKEKVLSESVEDIDLDKRKAEEYGLKFSDYMRLKEAILGPSNESKK